MIRAAIIAMAVAFAAAPAKAEEPESVCVSIGELAEGVIGSRYAGVPLSDSMAVANLPEFASIRSALREMVIQAYREPSYETEEYRAKAIRDFRNRWELACYELEGDLV